MAVPIPYEVIVLFPFNLAQQVSLDCAVAILTHSAVLLPSRKILSIEASVESGGQQVHVHVVELEAVKHVEWANGGHFLILIPSAKLNNIGSLASP